MKFVMELPEGDDGPHIFKVNGEQVGYADHDEMGWDGMSRMKNMFFAIADAAGCEVEEIWLDGEDE